MSNQTYEKMWQDFGKGKKSYLGYKFEPTYRIGLTNYLRELLIIKFIDPQKEDVLLDCGCAAGKQLFALSKSIKAGYGTDIAQSFVDMADKHKQENNVENLFFSQSDIEEMPFEDSFFDKIICGEVLEHVFDKDIALGELGRVLKTGGTLLITVPNMNADATLWGRFLRLIKVRKFTPIDVFSKEELVKHGDAHVREFSKKSLSQWLEKNDYEVKVIKSASFIDGPRWFEFLLKVLLHIKIIQKAIIGLEKFLTNINLFFGRQLIIKAIKK
ncbi:methyltransferase domain-containing protein [Candidatus Parcubacteria bacterium]|jgi:ubiquinone/menaquinone biosynthesis C-methylase UbiE|nr:methyltransferase domain-containing protein [Candidatus Parcubacteria bacterium]MBT7228204.1 methyltransferase domain-containing protein [Candidatus Parcubacteria bacterium]